jgi:adenylate cyclase
MAEGRAQRRLAAILAADVVGYSQLTEANDLFKTKIAKRAGRLIKTTGDRLLAKIHSGVETGRCAIEVQRAPSENLMVDGGWIVA